MKFLIFFALAFAAVWAKDLYSPLIEVPVLENEGRIYDGLTAAPGQFKYMVGLDFDLDTETLWCSGSLIGKEWVLTVAHCTIGAPWVMAYLGSTIFKGHEKVYNVSRAHFLPHPVYTPSNFKNDIAVIRIPETNTSSNIGFVRIPNNDNNKFLGRNAVISGWGQTDERLPIHSDVLKYAILEVSPEHICIQIYGHYYSDDVRLCVDVRNKRSPCQGDSGSPLVLQEPNVQIGLVSYGVTRCGHGVAAVFTRLSAYRLWIMVRTGIRY